MLAESRLGRRLSLALVQVGLAGLYFVAAKLGLRLAFQNPSATPVWPPTGIALAAFVLGGPRLWPGVFAGAFLANLTTAGTVATSLAIATGNTLEGWVGGALALRFAHGSHAFHRPRTIVLWTVFAAILAPAISASIGVASLTLAGYGRPSQFGATWLTWWMGDAGGALVVAPFLILWVRNPRLHFRPLRVLEVVAVASGFILLSGLVYGVPWRLGTRTYSIPFLFPLLAWVAFRLGSRSTSTAVVLVSALSIWGTLEGEGWFGGKPKADALVHLQLFLAVSSVTSLAVSAAVEEGQANRRELALQREEAREEMNRASFLAEGGTLLTSSLDCRATLAKIAELAARRFADACAVHLIEPDTGVGMVALAHRPEGQARWTREVMDLVLGGPASSRGLGNVLRTGHPEIYPEITLEMLRSGAPDEARLRELLGRGLTSAMMVPVLAGSRVLGALTFMRDVSPLRYDLKDLALGQMLADRVGLAVENAFLYRQVRRELDERRRAEKALTWLAAAVESSEDAIITVDLEGKVTSWNSGAKRLYGYSSEEMVGKSLSLIVPAELQAEESGNLERIKSGQRVEHYDTRRVKRDGHNLQVSVMFSSVRDAQGAVVGASTVARDVTQRKRGEAAHEFLAESGKILASALEWEVAIGNVARLVVPRIADFCMIHQRDGEGAAWKLATCRHVRPEIERALEGLSWTPWGSPDGERRRFPGDQAELLPEVTPGMLERFVTGPGTGSRPEDLGIRSLIEVPLRAWAETAGVLTLATTRDSGRDYDEKDLALAEELARRVALVIENAQLYRRLQEFNRVLEVRVAERTRELKEALTELEGFSYTVAHDLRAPLRSIASFSGLLQEDYGSKLDEGGRDYLERITNAARKMDALVVDLLSYSRLATGEMRLEAVPTDALLGEVLFQMAAEIRERRARIQVDSPLGAVVGHPLMLRQAFSNLIGNAIKFVGEGVDPQVRVRSEPRGNRRRIWVEDNGIGIPSDQHDRIFQIFERLEPGRYPGTGVGLAIVRKALYRMGGSSGVESMPGEGSRFWIELPAAADDGSGLPLAGGGPPGRIPDPGPGAPRGGASGPASGRP